MNNGQRAARSEFARRVNTAGELVRSGSSVAEVVAEVARRYAISSRQARRYVQAAQQVGAALPVPGPKVVFTVKLPADLVERLHGLADQHRRTLSDLVSEALEDLFARRVGGGGHARAD